jgi:hypothetical protein
MKILSHDTEPFDIRYGGRFSPRTTELKHELDPDRPGVIKVYLEISGRDHAGPSTMFHSVAELEATAEELQQIQSGAGYWQDAITWRPRVESAQVV